MIHALNSLGSLAPLNVSFSSQSCIDFHFLGKAARCFMNCPSSGCGGDLVVGRVTSGPSLVFFFVPDIYSLNKRVAYYRMILC